MVPAGKVVAVTQVSVRRPIDGTSARQQFDLEGRIHGWDNICELQVAVGHVKGLDVLAGGNVDGMLNCALLRRVPGIRVNAGLIELQTLDLASHLRNCSSARSNGAGEI